MKKNKKVLNETKKFIKENKKKIIITSIIVAVIIIGIILYNNFNKNNNLSIEISSTNVNYIYGPGSETILKVKKNDTVDIKILTSNINKSMVKCYASNKNSIEFIDDDTFKAVNKGTTEIYCKLLNKKSNTINLTIGG